MDLFRVLKVRSPVFPSDSNKFITLSSDASITQGFQTLISNNIGSVPIFDQKNNKYVSSLSMVDVVLHALDTHMVTDDVQSWILSAFTGLVEKEEFRRHKAVDVAGKAKRPPPVISNMNVTIDQVVDIMVKTKAHQILALDEKGNLRNIFTQTRVVECTSLLFGVEPHLTALAVKTVGELGLGIRDVLCVNEHSKAADAFRMIADYNASGIAVVNNHGTLVGNISVRDLSAIKSDASFFRLLFLPVCEYLEANRKEYGRNKLVVKCGLESTYRSVVESIVENKVHRCYVVDENNKLIGVVSLWDLLCKLVEFFPGPISHQNVEAPQL